MIGVLPAGFQSPDEISQRQPMLFVVPDCWPPNVLHNRGEHYDHAIARLKPGVPLAQAQSEMQTIGARLAKAYPQSNGRIVLGVAARRRHGAPCADRHVGAARRSRAGAADRLRQRG